MPMFDDPGSMGERRVSFHLASAVVRSMNDPSVWDSRAGGGGGGSGGGSRNFEFESIGVDGEVEEIHVQRLDDTTFDDLNFFGMEDDGSELGAAINPGAEVKKKTVGTGHLTATANHRQGRSASVGSVGNTDSTGSINSNGGRLLDYPSVPARGGGDGPLRVTVKKEALTASASARDVVGMSVFNPDGRLPTFSTPMEEFLNRQLEAAEHFIRCDGAGAGVARASSSSSTHMHAARGAGVFPLALDPATRDTVNPDQDVHMCKEEGLHDTAFPGAKGGRSAHNSVGLVGGGYGRLDDGAQQQSCGIDASEPDEEDSSASEYEPPREEKEKATKVTRKTGRRARGGVGAAMRPPAKAGDGLARAAERRSGGGVGAAGAIGSGTLKRQTSEDVAARLPLQVLEHFYHVPLNIAAQELNVSLTMLKKLCRAYGVKRWPHRQVSSLDKTIARLENKIKARRDGGKDAPSLSRKLSQGKKRRSVIIKTASAGLEADVLNTIFTCRPGDIDEDLLLESSDVAKAVGKLTPRRGSGSGHHAKVDSEEDDENDGGGDNGEEGSCFTRKSSPPSGGASSNKKPASRGLVKTAAPRSSASFSSSSSSSSSIPSSCKKPSSGRGSAKVSESLHPPAFEPAGPFSTTFSNRVKKADSKAAETKATSVKRHKKGGGGVAPAAIKGGKGVTATSAAAAPTLPKGKSTVKLSLRDLNAPGSSSNGAGGGVVSMVDGSLSGGCPSPTFPFGVSPGGGVAPMAGYSGIFGMGLGAPPAVTGGGSRGVGYMSTAQGAVSYARESAAEQSNNEVAAHIEGSQRRTAGWHGVAAEKQAASFVDWRLGRAMTPQVGPAWQLSASDVAGSDSSTMASTADLFTSKLRLEPPPQGQLTSSPSLPPLPPGIHAYMQQHQFPGQQHQHPHHHFHHLNWVQATYAGPPQQPHAFAMDAMSPVVPGAGGHAGGGHGPPAVSKTADGGDETEAGMAAARGTATSGGTGGGVCGGGGDGDVAAGGGAAGAATGNNSGDSATAARAGVRRTGYMSFLLHQSPNCPPFKSDPPPPPPLAASSADT